MARRPRIEFAGAVYHVINRGRRGRDLFGQAERAEAFERLLLEASGRCGWELAGYCLIGDHYHLALTTPKGNLVDGMQWLQSAFANGLKKSLPGQGEVFERRYRAILVEPGPLVRQLVDFLHLNPVRSGLRSVYNLESYPWSSFPKYLDRSGRPECLTCAGWLRHLKGLRDSPAGWARYREHLAAVTDLAPAEREKLIGKMCRGPVLGSREYRLRFRGGFEKTALTGGVAGADLREMNRTEWERLTAEFLAQLGKTEADLLAARKSAEWKAAVAWTLKQRTSVTNPWLSRRLKMGPPAMVSRVATAFGHLPPEVRQRYRLEKK